MKLGTRMLLMLSVFLLLIALFAIGTMFIFEKMNMHLSAIKTVSEESKIISELDRNVNEFVSNVRDWGLTGDPKYRRLFKKRLIEVYRNFGLLSAKRDLHQDMHLLGLKFGELLQHAELVINNREPVGDPDITRLMGKIDPLTIEIISKIDAMQERAVNTVSDLVAAGEEVRQRMIFYHVLLILFSTVTAFFLIVSIRRAVSSPISELLKATSRIKDGDLSYRISMQRNDEFGVVSERFNEMVADLELSAVRLGKRLDETELVLDITRMAGATLDRKDAFEHIVRTLAEKLNYVSCSIYMPGPDGKSFCLEASNDPEKLEQSVCMPVSEKQVSDLMDSADAVWTGIDGGLAVPIIRDRKCNGMIVIRNRSEYRFSDGEINILKIVAHTADHIIQNAELYAAARQQIQKMAVLFDLSRAITSLLDLQQLLRKVSEEVSLLVSSRGCIIRLIEENVLRIKASYGLSREKESDLDLSMGEGIAGWVAEHGEPMLVEDASKIASNMKLPGLDIKTAICVPLIVGERVIGTLSLYDKYDASGTLIPFSTDDMSTLSGFASISAIAIEKARIYENEIIRQQQAVDEKKRLNILFDSVQGGIITLDRDFVITSANKYIEEWVGISNPELIGRSSLDVFHDRIGICPHCASKSTFETGDINTITQSRGVNYAELTAYPIRNEQSEVSECVVFIMDITERVLYQEETLSLYREVIQTKDYLESIIDNSADAIITSDMNGIVTSWNIGAEKIFGFSAAEASGKFLPFVPEFLNEKEKEYIEHLRSGEILKDIETLRKRNDGTLIEVSLTLSPIKDASGNVIGICGISRDISEKKRVEKDLIRRNQEMSRLFFISSAMRSTLELDKLLRMVLTAVTMSDGMGFNRAILFLVDESRRTLKGVMGVGPATPEEAWKVWDDMSLKHKTLEDIMQEIIVNPVHTSSFLERLTVGIEISLDEHTVLTKAVSDRIPFNVLDVKQEMLSDAVIIQQLGTQAYAVVPLISRDKVIGLIWVDNYFNRKQITDNDMQFLSSFSNQVAAAIENARLFEQVTMAEQQLENIFESMSDMVYFNSKDYVVQKINKAVVKRLGLRQEEIIGKKCYELFHGTDEPYHRCPHRKTVTTKQAYIEEIEDPHLNGTFLTSSSPIFDSAGEFIGSVHVVRDVTDLKHLQKKLVMTEKMAALGEVAARVAHEIRNPLVSVGGFAKRLEKKLDGNLKEYAGIIVKEVSRLESILREILGFVKEVRLAREIVNLNILSDEILQVMMSDIEDRGITLVREYGNIPDVFVDPNRVKEAIMNIVTNAMQSISGTGTIYVRTYAEENDSVMEISDTGKGIPDAELTSIFNPFFTTKSSGTGLGLAITHRIIQEHGGRIEVNSIIDKGTAFKVYLPIKEESI